MRDYENLSRRLSEAIAGGDFREALKYLNGLTEYRFTALYRFDEDMLSNRLFFDRENPEVLSTQDIPVAASYCVYVRDTAGPFTIADSLEDPRVAGHHKRPIVRSYCGVPLVDEQGRMFGSICHFDFAPHAPKDTDVHLLEEVAPLLLRSGAGPRQR
jgi:GAF domain-containing protein